MVDAGEVEQARAEFASTQKKLDQAAAKNLIHKNKASRLKSRIAKLISEEKQSAS